MSKTTVDNLPKKQKVTSFPNKMLTGDFKQNKQLHKNKIPEAPGWLSQQSM